MKPQKNSILIILLAITAFSFTGVAQAQAVGATRDAYYESLRAHANGKATLRDVERSYSRLQKAKSKRDAKEKKEEQQRKQRMSKSKKTNSGQPQSNSRLEYGRGLLSFTPELSFARQFGEVDTAPIEYRNGEDDITVRKMPGIKKFTNITLKRGVTGSIDWSNFPSLRSEQTKSE